MSDRPTDTRTESKPDLPHLSELHARAQALGIPKFRGMRKEELADEISRREKGGRPSRSGRKSATGGGFLARLKAIFGGGTGAKKAKGKRAEKGPSARKGQRGGGGRRPNADEEGFEITGKLDRMPRGYGFVRVGEGKSDEDVYLSPSQIRRCSVKPGDEVRGIAREPRKGERHRAMVRVVAVNGKEV